MSTICLPVFRSFQVVYTLFDESPLVRLGHHIARTSSPNTFKICTQIKQSGPRNVLFVLAPEIFMAGTVAGSDHVRVPVCAALGTVRIGVAGAAPHGGSIRRYGRVEGYYMDWKVTAPEILLVQDGGRRLEGVRSKEAVWKPTFSTVRRFEHIYKEELKGREGPLAFVHLLPHEKGYCATHAKTFVRFAVEIQVPSAKPDISSSIDDSA